MKKKPKAWLVTHEWRSIDPLGPWQKDRYLTLRRANAREWHIDTRLSESRNLKIIPLYAEEDK